MDERLSRLDSLINRLEAAVGQVSGGGASGGNTSASTQQASTQQADTYDLKKIQDLYN